MEHCINDKSDCFDCIYLCTEIKEGITCEVKMIKNALDLINRKQVENDELAQQLSDLITEKDELFDVVEQQKVEIEKLKALEIEIDKFCRNLYNIRLFKGKTQPDFEDLLDYIENEKKRAIKKFIDRLENEYMMVKIPNSQYCEDEVVKTEDIQNVLKEMRIEPT